MVIGGLRARFFPIATSTIPNKRVLRYPQCSEPVGIQSRCSRRLTQAPLIACLSAGSPKNSACRSKRATSNGSSRQTADSKRTDTRSRSKFWALKRRAGNHVAGQVLVSPRSTVYFFAESGIARNVLGRRGWLDRLRFGLVDYDQAIYIAE